MPIVERAVSVIGPIDEVFDLSQSSTETDSRDGLRTVTEYQTSRRPALVEVRMVEGPRWFRTFSGSWHFTEQPEGRVEVSVRYDFSCSSTLLAPIMERIGVWYLGRHVTERLEAIVEGCTRTEPLDRVRRHRDARVRPSDAGSASSATVPPVVDAAWLRARLAADPTVVICHVGSEMAGSDPLLEFERRHLPGARFVSLDDQLAAAPAGTEGRHPLPSPADFADALGGLGIDDDATVLAYDVRGGAFAGRLVWMLRILGRPAALLDGGIEGWIADSDRENGAVESGPGAVVARVERAVLDWPPVALADAVDVAQHVSDDGVVIDSRDPARYAGEIEPIDAVAGHVPGAFNLAYADNLGSDGRFRSSSELRDRFASLTSDDAHPIVYCGSGVTACHNALAMEHAGLGLPRVYVGSWSGWTADPERPVATGDMPWPTRS